VALGVSSISDGRDTLAGTGASRDPALHRSAVKLRQKRLIAPEWVRFVGICLRPETSTLE